MNEYYCCNNHSLFFGTTLPMNNYVMWSLFNRFIHKCWHLTFIKRFKRANSGMTNSSVLTLPTSLYVQGVNSLYWVAERLRGEIKLSLGVCDIFKLVGKFYRWRDRLTH